MSYNEDIAAAIDAYMAKALTERIAAHEREGTRLVGGVFCKGAHSLRTYWPCPICGAQV
jgi:hypothetical protein